MRTAERTCNSGTEGIREAFLDLCVKV